MCCAAFIVKYVLFFVNLVFSLVGIALVGMGIAVLLNINQVVDAIPINISGIPIFVIVVGAIVFLIAFFGCCGAIKENRCFLVMYAIIMAILAALKIYLAAVIFQHLSDIEATVAEWVTDAFENNSIDVFGVLEATFECCGTTGADSYTGNLPPTCCASPVNNICAVDDAFQGCVPRLTSYVSTFGEAIGGILIAVIIAELVAMVFASFLAHSIKNKNRR